MIHSETFPNVICDVFIDLFKPLSDIAQKQNGTFQLYQLYDCHKFLTRSPALHRLDFCRSLVSFEGGARATFPNSGWQSCLRFRHWSRESTGRPSKRINVTEQSNYNGLNAKNLLMIETTNKYNNEQFIKFKQRMSWPWKFFGYLILLA